MSPPGGAPLVVYASVLPWIGSRWRDLAFAEGAFQAALSAQLDDWRRLRARFPEAALGVLGDLNQDLSAKHYYGSSANRRALAGALAAAGVTALTGDPTHPVRAHNPERASIDHICVSDELARSSPKQLEVWPPTPVPDRRLSDHFGVAATLLDA